MSDLIARLTDDEWCFCNEGEAIMREAAEEIERLERRIVEIEDKMNKISEILMPTSASSVAQ
jgi:predicted transcriptional regulator